MTEKYQVIKIDRKPIYLFAGKWYTYTYSVELDDKEVFSHPKEEVCLDLAAALNLGAESRSTPVFPRLEIS